MLHAGHYVASAGPSVRRIYLFPADIVCRQNHPVELSMLFAHMVVSYGAVFPIREQFNLSHQAVVGRRTFGDQPGRVVFGLRPCFIEYFGYLPRLLHKLGRALAVAEQLIQFLQLGQRFGSGKVV